MSPLCQRYNRKLPSGQKDLARMLLWDTFMDIEKLIAWAGFTDILLMLRTLNVKTQVENLTFQTTMEAIAAFKLALHEYSGDKGQLWKIINMISTDKRTRPVPTTMVAKVISFLLVDEKKMTVTFETPTADQDHVLRFDKRLQPNQIPEACKHIRNMAKVALEDIETRFLHVGIAAHMYILHPEYHQEPGSALDAPDDVPRRAIRALACWAKHFGVDAATLGVQYSHMRDIQRVRHAQQEPLLSQHLLQHEYWAPLLAAHETSLPVFCGCAVKLLVLTWQNASVERDNSRLRLILDDTSGGLTPDNLDTRLRMHLQGPPPHTLVDRNRSPSSFLSDLVQEYHRRVSRRGSAPAKRARSDTGKPNPDKRRKGNPQWAEGSPSLPVSMPALVAAEGSSSSSSKARPPDAEQACSRESVQNIPTM